MPNPARHFARPALTAGLALVTAVGLAAEEEVVPTGRLVEGRSTVADAEQTYTLYLPTSYRPERPAPALLVLDPRGRSRFAAEIFREAAEELGWIILSSDQSRSDQEASPNARAVAALLSEAQHLFRADPKRIYLAGFSGTGNYSWAAAVTSGAIAGVLASGSRFPPGVFSEPFEFSTFGTAGDGDFNRMRMIEAAEQLERWDSPYRLELHPGTHSWMPPAVARTGLRWMETRAMREGRREPDEGALARWRDDEIETARALEESGDPLGATRLYEAIVGTYDGLTDVEAAREALDRLRSDPGAKRTRKLEERWTQWEARERERAGRALSTIHQDPPPSPGEYASRLELRSLVARTGNDGPEGAAARRLIGHLRAHLGFYLRREFLTRGDYGRAFTVLSAALEIEPEAADLHYDLACSLARLGRPDRALEALQQAVRFGFADRNHLLADPDLESLRDQPEFQAIAARLTAD